MLPYLYTSVVAFHFLCRISELQRIKDDERVREMSKAEEECRRMRNNATREYNEALAQTQRRKKWLEDRQNEDDNMTEIRNAICSDLLTENPNQAISQFGPNRHIPDRFKGFSAGKLYDIRKDQLKQQEEKRVSDI
ncbi:unnamed protein product [Protopolystoma xenopodis]|uniref:RIB43A-like with coiled-coils protein 2 n=1 Tax=Protopolystoma xenopodis TaxID=117903 RepID=A0A448WBW2_9PLAT|nr:unnamed protein product [Protopolystoma xenopodis]